MDLPVSKLMASFVFRFNVDGSVDNVTKYPDTPEPTPEPEPEPSPEPDPAPTPAPAASADPSLLTKAVKAVEDVVKPQKTRRGRPKKDGVD